MTRRSPLLFLLAALAGAPGAAAEPGNFAFSSDLSYGYSSELDASMQGVAELLPSLDIKLAASTSFVASARVRLDAADKLEPGRPSFASYASASRPLALGTAGTAELRDFYLEFASERGLTRIGKQQIVWGRLDGIKVLDLLNPQEFREFILDDFAESRISLWSAYLDYNIGNWRTELAIIPDATGHAIPDSGAWFELTAPRFRYGAQPGSPELPIVTITPGHSLDETAAGLRLSRQVGPSELAFVAYSGTDPEPLGRVIDINGTPTIEQYYKRRDAFGFSVDMGLGAVVLRAEYAYQPERTFNYRPSNQLATIELDQQRTAVGLDIDGPLGIFINMQYLVDTVSDAPAELVRPARDRIGTLYLRKAFGYDKFVLEARWYHSFSDADRLASVSFEYAFSDSTSFELAAHSFDGVDSGLFGQFAKQDRVTLTLRHTF